MKRTRMPLGLAIAAVIGLFISPAFGQNVLPPDSHAYYWYGHGHSINPDAARANAAAATTVPMWGYTITSNRDGNNYSGVMVGRSPFFHGKRTTNIPAVIIPLKVNMPDGGVFDPTAGDSCAGGGNALNLMQNSPIMLTHDFNFGGTDMGTVQYEDAFERANFFSEISATGNRYHTVLSPITTVPVQTVNVPSGDGATFPAIDNPGLLCANFGLINVNYWDPSANGEAGSGEVGTILSSLSGQGVNPTVIPILLLNNVAITTDISGGSGWFVYHDVEGSPPQTYSVNDFDTTNGDGNSGTGFDNTGAVAHEMGEWMDDPLVNNPTPAWGHIGQQPNCQNNLEVGDALTGTFIPPVSMPDGFTYDLQELVFFSWFYSSPSIGVNGWFSNNDTFTSDAGAPCT